MKEIYSKDIINILSSLFKFEIVETEIGLGVKLDWDEAFIFSSITGAGYLENKIYPYTPKGLLKIFQNALSYNFVSGIYERNTFLNTPLNIQKKRPYLFKGPKVIVPIDFDNEEELKKKLFEYGKKNNENILLYRVETSKKGNGMEPFLEYLACKYYNRIGYITENQVPLFATVGSPDFCAFKFRNDFNKIELNKKGFNILSLSLIRFQKNKLESFFNENNSFECIVGEAKTSNKNARNQIRKYLDTGLFNEAIEIYTSKSIFSNKYSKFYLDNNQLIYEKSENKCEFNIESQQLYKRWFINYCKFYLISNFTIEEFKEYYFLITGKEFLNNELVKFVVELKIDDIFIKVLKLQNNGTIK